MKVFEQHEWREAIDFACQDGELIWCLHLHFIVFAWSPSCFKRDISAGYPIAHMFSQDAELLEELARMNGVNVVKIERVGTTRQHIDLCGKPLRRCLAGMGDNIDYYTMAKYQQRERERKALDA